MIIPNFTAFVLLFYCSGRSVRFLVSCWNLFVRVESRSRFGRYEPSPSCDSVLPRQIPG